MIRPPAPTAVALAIALACSGCGLKGPLYLPDQVTNVEVRPAAGTTSSGEGSQPAAGSGVTGSTDDESDDDERSNSPRLQD